MLLRKNNRELSMIEVIDNLIHMAEIDWGASASDIIHISWRSPEHAGFNRERIKNTFNTLFKYLKELYEKEKGSLREGHVQRSLQAMMALAAEAVQNIDQHTPLFKQDKVGISALEEFKALQQFYLSKIEKQYQGLKQEESTQWQGEWGEGEEALGTLESVRKDRNYELFLIRKEDGTAYFNRALLRHVYLVTTIENLLMDPSIEDPFLRIRSVVDKEAHHAAKQILQRCSVLIDGFFKEALKFKRVAIVDALIKALMGLMLAANPRNLIQNSFIKSAKDYYRDFHYYLRAALHTEEYRAFLTRSSPHSGKFTSVAAQMAQALCGSFFMQTKEHSELVSLIISLMHAGRQGAILQSQTSSPLAFWNQWRDNDHALRYCLYLLPNGPLTKIIHSQYLTGFDPILKQQLVEQLYTIVGEQFHVSVYRLGCPTLQEVMTKAEVVAEFEAWLAVLGSPQKNQRYLMINLQDSTSWQEHARCMAIQQLSEQKSGFTVVTLAKNTEFYYQSGPYREWDDAAEFMKLMQEQVMGGQQCGFFLPPASDLKKLESFVEKATKTIHSLFFANKERLTHQNRLDFIEVFYLFLTLKWIEEFSPDLLSFSCKDGIDTGSCASCGLFAFLRMMNQASALSKAEREALFGMVYGPALTARFRAVDIRRFERMINALSLIQAELEAHHAEVIASCAKLYRHSFFNNTSLA